MNFSVSSADSPSPPWGWKVPLASTLRKCWLLNNYFFLQRESVELALQILDDYQVGNKKIHVELAKFQLKGEYDPKRKPKKKKKKELEKMQKKQEK